MLVILGRCESAKLIKEQLENIGMVVYIKEVSDSQYNYCLTNKNYQVLFTGVYNGYSPDVSYFYGDGNIANYSNDEVSTILNEVKNITNQKNLEDKFKVLIEKTKDSSCPIKNVFVNTFFDQKSLHLLQVPLKNINQPVERQRTGPFPGECAAGNIVNIQFQICCEAGQFRIVKRNHSITPSSVKYMFYGIFQVFFTK